MSLYGALYAGVAGLSAQSDKLGVISDNIANVNTIGYKQAASAFQALVTSSSSSSTYSPGGVINTNRQLVDTQGLLQTTSSATDIAISGQGLFVVNQKADQTGQVLYTRAGSFTQDAQGNFVNIGGLYLQAWPLDRNGLLPGEPGNLNTVSSANLASLKTVNVQNLAGTASSTTSVSVGANLKSSQTALAGAGSKIIMDALDIANYPLKGADIIVPTAVNKIAKNDGFNVATSTNPLGFNYTYGGFTFGRDITTALAAGNGENGQNLKANTVVLNNAFSTTNGSTTVTIASAGHGLATGDTVGFSVVPGAIGGISAATFLSNLFYVTVVDPNTITVVSPVAATATVAGVGGAVTQVTRPYAGNILDAQNASQTFFGVTGTGNIDIPALSFTIQTSATGTKTFTYTSAAPNSLLGQFNTMNNLADAISSVVGLTARVVNNRLYVSSSTDATQAITFANGQSVGKAGPPVLSGVDWMRELGLANVTSGANRFSSMQSLSTLVNNSAGLISTLENPLGAASLKINVVDPTQTITFKDNGPTGSLLSQFGISASLNGGAYVAKTAGPIGPAYNAQVAATNLASGAITAQFSRPVTVFDGLGSTHSINLAFLKIQNNTWAVEVYAQPATDITSTSATLVNGQIATGTVKFNGDGSLQSVSAALTAPLAINWTNGSVASTISINWGTAGLPFGTPGASAIGKTDGLSQFDSGYNVAFVNQNGAPVGQLTGISIDASGFITASYNNGQTQKLYKIPAASFSAPNLLRALSGNSYAQTNGSGIVNLKQAGQSGVGTISSGALEQSNVELASQLTDMIVAQRAYQANTKVIQTADALLNSLGQIVQ